MNVVNSLLHTGGGGIAVLGGQIQLRKIAGKLRKIAEKVRKKCDVVSGPPEPSRCYSSGQVAQNSQNFTETVHTYNKGKT